MFCNHYVVIFVTASRQMYQGEPLKEGQSSADRGFGRPDAVAGLSRH